jgi:hypothetical protein
MAIDTDKPMRPWVAWLVVGIWAGTVAGVLLASSVYPATTANLVVNTRRVAFETDAKQILSQSDEEQLLVTGLRSLHIEFAGANRIHVNGASVDTTSLSAEGDAAASCSLYLVRSHGFEVREPTMITLEALGTAKTNFFSLKSHGAVYDSLASLPDTRGLQSGIVCTGLRIGGGPSANVEARFTPAGGDSIFLATTADTRFDITTGGHSEIGDTQIPMLSEVRFSEVDPQTLQEKSVLLQPPPEITFEDVDKKVTSNSADLLVVSPKQDFYLRRFTVDNGIHLSMHGAVRQIRVGAGDGDLRTLMPSAFTRLSNSARLFSAIPAIAGLLLSILDKAGVLGKK